MAQLEASNWNQLVATVVRRSHDVSFMSESFSIVNVKELLSAHLPIKSLSPGWMDFHLDIVEFLFTFCSGCDVLSH